MAARNAVPEGLHVVLGFEDLQDVNTLVIPGRMDLPVCPEFCAWFAATYGQRRPDLREVYEALPEVDWLRWVLFKSDGAPSRFVPTTTYGLLAARWSAPEDVDDARRMVPLEVLLDELPVCAEPNVCPWVEVRDGWLYVGAVAPVRHFVCHAFLEWFEARWPEGCSLDQVYAALDRPTWVLWLWTEMQPDWGWVELAEHVALDLCMSGARWTDNTPDPALCDQLREAFPLEVLVDVWLEYQSKRPDHP